MTTSFERCMVHLLALARSNDLNADARVDDYLNTFLASLSDVREIRMAALERLALEFRAAAPANTVTGLIIDVLDQRRIDCEQDLR